MRFIFVLMVSGFFSMVFTQENIDPYLLTDSLEIQALLDADLPDQSKPEVSVQLYSLYGLGVRSLTHHEALNQALDTLGYGQLTESPLCWTFANQINIGDHLSLGFSYLSNVFISPFQRGATGSSKLTFFNFLIDIAYGYDVATVRLAPECGLGISTNTLSFKPNDLEALSWKNFHENKALVSALNQTDLSLSLGLGLSKKISWIGNKSRLLKFRAGMIFSPFALNDLGVNNGEWSFVKLKDAPPVSSSGLYFGLTLGTGNSNE